MTKPGNFSVDDIKLSSKTITGRATIDRALEIHRFLLDGLNEAESLHLDIRGISEVDVTFTQLLCSAHRSAVDQRKKLTLDRTGNTTLHEHLHYTGMLRHTGCVKQDITPCLWIEGE